MIDTSIIGFEDGFPNGDEWSYFDGMNHLWFSNRRTFIENQSLFTSTIIKANQDEFGFLIDKINIESGEVEWQISVDPRISDFSHRLMNMRISNNRFIVEGSRKEEEDDVPINFWFGTFPGYYFKMEYDLITGELIDYLTPSNGDTLAFTAPQRAGFNNYFYSDTLRQYISLPFSLVTGVHAIRTTFDNKGLLETVNDTVIAGKFNDQANEALRSNESFKGKIKQGRDGSFLFIHEFIPLESSELSMEAVLMKYDQNFNVVDSVDLMEFIFGEFKSMAILEYIDDRILLRGCKAVGSICNPFYYLLDHDYNLINSVLAQGPNGNVGGEIHIDENDNISILSWDFIDDGNSKIVLNHEDQPFMDTVRNYTLIETSWAASANYYSQLVNGDWLVKFTHGCWDDGIFNSFFHEVWRVSEEDFALMVSTTDAISESEDLKISPNPAGDYIRLDLEQNYRGSIKLYDAQGREVLSLSDRALNGSDIDVSQLSSGIYTLQINAEGLTRQRRFVKM